MAKVQAESIHRLRELKGWSQNELALEAGIDAKTLNSVLKGNAYQQKTIRRIADALGVTPADLLEGSPPPAADANASAEQRLQVQVVLSMPFDSVKTATGLSELLRHITTLIDAKSEISVVDVKAGSVVITLEMSLDDVLSLIVAAASGELEEIEFVSLTVLDDILNVTIPSSRDLDPDFINGSLAEMYKQKKETVEQKGNGNELEG